MANTGRIKNQILKKDVIFMSTILITGGAGFIGSNFVKYMLDKYSEYDILNLDALTYCGNLENLKILKTWKITLLLKETSEIKTL